MWAHAWLSGERVGPMWAHAWLSGERVGPIWAHAWLSGERVGPMWAHAWLSGERVGETRYTAEVMIMPYLYGLCLLYCNDEVFVSF